MIALSIIFGLFITQSFSATLDMELQKEVHRVGKKMEDHDMERVMEMVG